MSRDGGVTSECSCERGCLHLAGRDSTDTRASRSSFEDNLRSSHARMVKSAYRLSYFLLSAILRSQGYFLLLTLVGTLLLFVVGQWEEGRGVRGQRLGRVLVIDRCVTRAGLPSCSLAHLIAGGHCVCQGSPEKPNIHIGMHVCRYVPVCLSVYQDCKGLAHALQTGKPKICRLET